MCAVCWIMTHLPGGRVPNETKVILMITFGLGFGLVICGIVFTGVALR